MSPCFLKMPRRRNSAPLMDRMLRENRQRIRLEERTTQIGLCICRRGAPASIAGNRLDGPCELCRRSPVPPIERHRHIVASRGSPYWAVRVQGPRCIAPSVSCVQYRKGGDPRRVPLRPQVDLPRSSTHPIDASNHKAFPSLSTR